MYRTPSGYYQNVGINSYVRGCDPDYGAAFAITARKCSKYCHLLSRPFHTPSLASTSLRLHFSLREQLHWGEHERRHVVSTSWTLATPPVLDSILVAMLIAIFSPHAGVLHLMPALCAQHRYRYTLIRRMPYL